MVETKTLFHRNDPETSEIAADKMVKSGALSRQEQKVYNDIRRYIIDGNRKDFTAKELAKWSLFRGYYTIQRRLSGLRNKGRIERIQTGIKITHTRSIPSLKIEKPIYKTRDGCCVWKIS